MERDKILRVNTIEDYCNRVGLQASNPLVCVLDFSKCQPLFHERMMFGFYAIFLKDVKCGDIIYGRQTYDYQEGTIVCLAPGQVMGLKDTGQKFQPKGMALCFHPDLIHGTSLGKNIKEYSYFSYEVREALHISEEERDLFKDCLDKINNEINGATDRLSKRLIARNIELLLDYCLRFYERQFVTRANVNRDILTRFDHTLDQYLDSPKASQLGLPTVKYCANVLCLSPNYFGDLIKKETGITAQEYIQHKIVETAKEHILDPATSISQVAYTLGFQYPQHFTRMFKRVTGITPNQFRMGAAN